MKFSVENLGFIDKGEIELNNITVICGENNVGKTYLTYSIYGFLSNFKNNIPILSYHKNYNEYIDELYSKGSCNIDLKYFEQIKVKDLNELLSSYIENLNLIFSASKDSFKNTNISFDIEKVCSEYKKIEIDFIQNSSLKQVKVFKDKGSSMLELELLDKNLSKYFLSTIVESIIHRFIFSRNFSLFPVPFIVTSERTGASLFYKELDINKNNVVEQITKNIDNNINDTGIISKMLSRYPVPIKDNIDYIRDFDLISKNKSFIIENKNIFKNWEKLLGGKFESLNNEIYFFPQKEAKRSKVNPIPIYMTSSSSKSLLLLDLYIKSIAQPNQILIIDEPELNLHPSKQIYMARLLAQLSNMGIKILITTHSDFIVKEFNNLIMLSNEFKNKEKIMKKYKYDDSEVLNKDKINFYIASKDHTIKKIDVNNNGVDLESFDDVIIDINNRSDEIYYSLQDD